jgi:hypothetical protein
MVRNRRAWGFFLIKNVQTSSRVCAKYTVTTAAREPCGLFLPQLDLAAGRGPERPMFRMPAYDPFAIAVLGFGILLAAAFAFRF